MHLYFEAVEDDFRETLPWQSCCEELWVSERGGGEMERGRCRAMHVHVVWLEATVNEGRCLWWRTSSKEWLNQTIQASGKAGVEEKLQGEEVMERTTEERAIEWNGKSKVTTLCQKVVIFTPLCCILFFCSDVGV